jgi:large subunit ribosomal protein L10
MPRPEKVQAVADIKERLEVAEAVFLTEYRGLSVKAVQELRTSLRASGAEYKVVKMTLARLAAGEAGISGLDEYLLGPTALAFAKGDPVATAKALKDFSKSHELFVLKAGVLSGNILTPEQVSRLADIEPREVLLAKIAGAAKAPLVQAAGLFASFNRNAATMFHQLLEKMESAEPAPAGGESNAALPVDEPTETEPAATAEEPTETEVAALPDEPTVIETAASADEPTEPEAAALPDEPAEPEADASDDEPTENETAALADELAEPEAAALPADEPAEPEADASADEPAEPETAALPADEPAEPEADASADEPAEPETADSADEPTENETAASAEEE